MKFIDALRNASKRIVSELQDSNLFDHKGERGRFREFMIQKLLRPHLPNSCEIGTGLVFDSQGISSRQMDIVLYDNLFGNVLFRDGDTSLFPCENVYGALEVKSRLDTKQLEEAIENSYSLKVLSREEATGLTITPFYHLSLAPPLSGPNKKANFYFHGVVAFSSIDPLSLSRFLSTRITEGVENLPDYIWIYDPVIFILGFSQDKANYRYPTPLGCRPDEYLPLNTFEDTFPMMLIAINMLLSVIRLKAPNYHKYWNLMLGEVSNVFSSDQKG